ncbi:YwqG family protein (plasmid) [Streptomyces sp. NBC_01208]|uniref:DUF1963 domain-containing protein n=1 Tax=Streptomyces sp. NBC_01208 TaxID=2903773 RepID=UPI002E15ECC6|nr:YwqG family protein [Streptomyces sp. NBC_01208]
MNALDDYRAAARGRGVPEQVLDRALRLARPRLELRPMENSNAPVAGQYGGHPQLPPDVEWSGFPAFIASVNCAALPLGQLDIPLPEDGHLLFFANIGEPNYVPGPRKEGRVVHVPAGTATAERIPSEEERPYVFEPHPLRSRRDWSVPAPINLTVDHEIARLIDPYLADYVDETMYGELTLGGYSSVIHHDPAPWPATDQESLILLARADYELVNNPLTCAASWLIHPRDLAEKNFENVQIDFQVYM